MFPTFTWPDWRTAPSGTRFRVNQTGRTGVYIKPARSRHNGAIVVWDDQRCPVRSVCDVPNSVYFIGIARDATPIED